MKLKIISQSFLEVKQLDYKISFIYSDFNTINLYNDEENDYSKNAARKIGFT